MNRNYLTRKLRQVEAIDIILIAILIAAAAAVEEAERRDNMFADLKLTCISD